jgi:hypothetical protein
MSKKTLANRLREFADKIEKLPDAYDFDVRLSAHFNRSPEELSLALNLVEGLEAEIGNLSGTYWVTFKNIHGEPIELTAYYRPEDMEGVQV